MLLLEGDTHCWRSLCFREAESVDSLIIILPGSRPNLFEDVNPTLVTKKLAS
jgi:hypothetical protein